MNVTYNYAGWYYMDGVFPEKNGEKKGIRTIYEMSGAESIPVLKAAIKNMESLLVDLLDEDVEDCKGKPVDYWTQTRENAIKPLYQLLAFAQMRPDGVWEGD